MIVIWPASAGRCELSAEPIPSCVPTLTMKSCRSSVTSPFAVEMPAFDLPSRMATSCFCAALFTAFQAAWTRGRSRNRSTAVWAGSRNAPAMGPERPLRLGGNRCSSRAWTCPSL